MVDFPSNRSASILDPQLPHAAAQSFFARRDQSRTPKLAVDFNRLRVQKPPPDTIFSGFPKTGDPTVTMGFNTKSLSTG